MKIAGYGYHSVWLNETASNHRTRLTCILARRTSQSTASAAGLSSGWHRRGLDRPKTVSQPEFFLCLRLRLFGGLHCAVPSKQISATACERNKNADYNAENVMLHRVFL